MEAYTTVDKSKIIFVQCVKYQFHADKAEDHPQTIWQIHQAIQQAIKLLGDPDLEDAYTAAWQEWEDAGEAEAWAVTVADGVK